MPHCLTNSTFPRAIPLLLASMLLAACAGERPANDQPYEPSFQEKLAECSKIADRSERNRCLYGG
jgi:outer membrane biogenesis lipoprotein LolB